MVFALQTTGPLDAQHLATVTTGRRAWLGTLPSYT